MIHLNDISFYYYRVLIIELNMATYQAIIPLTFIEFVDLSFQKFIFEDANSEVERLSFQEGQEVNLNETMEKVEGFLQRLKQLAFEVINHR